jgi:AraC-like DNA-binding protein
MNARTKPTGTAPPLTAQAHSATVIAGYGLIIAKALDYSGVDSRQVFATAGINEALRNDPLKRLSLATISRLYRKCVEVTGDPYFGLTVAKLMQPSTLHALGYGLLASATLMDFCTRVQRYFRLVSQNARVDIVLRGAEVHFSTVPLVDVCPESQDAWLGTLHRMIRLLHRDDFHPIAVELAHAMPDPGDEPYAEFFGAPARFGCHGVTLILARDDMNVALQGACPELAQLNDNLAENYIAKLDRADVVTNVRARIVELLPSGECSRSKVAAALCMSTSTLQQRLIERGTSFHALLNEIRHELASSYLRQSGISVTEITFLLGFADVSNFTRAFKRWTGRSPTRFRNQE